MTSQIRGLIPFQKVEYIQYVFSRKVIPLKSSMQFYNMLTVFNAPADNFMSLISPCWNKHWFDFDFWIFISINLHFTYKMKFIIRKLEHHHLRERVESMDLTFPTQTFGGKNLVFTLTSYIHFRLPYQGEKTPERKGCSCRWGKRWTKHFHESVPDSWSDSFDLKASVVRKNRQSSILMQSNMCKKSII